jgi:hypothetical protein
VDRGLLDTRFATDLSYDTRIARINGQLLMLAMFGLIVPAAP